MRIAERLSRGSTLLLAATLGALLGSGANAEPRVVRGVFHYSDESKTRLIIQADGPLTYEAAPAAHDPNRLEIDLLEAEAPLLQERFEVDSREVRTVELIRDPSQPGVVRLSVLQEGSVASSFSQIGNKLFVDFVSQDGTAEPLAPPPLDETPIQSALQNLERSDLESEPASLEPAPAALSSDAPAAEPDASGPAPEPNQPEPLLPTANDSQEAPAPAVVRSSSAAVEIPPAAIAAAEQHQATVGVGDLLDPSLPMDPARELDGLVHRTVDGGLVVAVRGDGKLRFKAFEVPNPHRVVVDFEGVRNGIYPRVVDVGHPLVQRIRTSQYRSYPSAVARVVFDTHGSPTYRTFDNGSQVIVTFGSAGALVDQALQTQAPEPPAPTPPPEPRAQAVQVTSSPEPQAAEAAAAVPAPAPARVERRLEELKPVDLLAQSPQADESQLLALNQTAGMVRRAQSTTGAATRPEEPSGSFPGRTLRLADSYQPRSLGPGTEGRYSGIPITLDFKDADVKDVFRLFAQISGYNVVVDPSVSGTITITLKDVPWDQALDIILKNNGLDKVYENNVIRIATAAKLAQEEANRRRLREEQALAVSLETVTWQLSYAKAPQVRDILVRNLSRRGEVIVDDRTNTLIITDIPGQVRLLRSLIEILDIPVPQVEIEARVVESTRDFANALGIQWGFRAEQGAQFGNNTDLTFPNNYTIQGDGIGGGAQQPSRAGIGATPWAVNLPLQQVSPFGGIGMTFGNILDSFRLDLALQAGESDGKARFLFRPKVSTQNNTKAIVSSGQRIPVPAVGAFTASVRFENADLRLEVTPQITANDTIILDVLVDESIPDFGRTVNGIPTINRKQAETRLLVDNGGTAVIAGVLTSRENVTYQGVPGFSSIPILGHLFKTRARTDNRDELLIFLTPRILR